MILSEKDSQLYYRLMWALHIYVSQKLNLSDIHSIDDYVETDFEQKKLIQGKLYDHIDIIDSFIKENPDNFSTEELDIVLKFKKFHRGVFFIERILKKHAIFINNDDDVYAVLGISTGFDDMIDSRSLPVYVETVLLPFNGKIIYDGILNYYNMFFGGGIKRRLKETYMTAKQNNRIIETLETPPEKTQNAPDIISADEWSLLLEEIADKASRLKTTAASPAIWSPSFSMVKASIEFAQVAVSPDRDMERMSTAVQRLSRAFKKVITVLDRY